MQPVGVQTLCRSLRGCVRMFGPGHPGPSSDGCCKPCSIRVFGIVVLLLASFGLGMSSLIMAGQNAGLDCITSDNGAVSGVTYYGWLVTFGMVTFVGNLILALCFGCDLMAEGRLMVSLGITVLFHVIWHIINGILLFKSVLPVCGATASIPQFALALFIINSCIAFVGGCCM